MIFEAPGYPLTMAQTLAGRPPAFPSIEEDLARLRRRAHRQMDALATTLQRLRSLQREVECHLHGRLGYRCARCGSHDRRR